MYIRMLCASCSVNSTGQHYWLTTSLPLSLRCLPAASIAGHGAPARHSCAPPNLQQQPVPGCHACPSIWSMVPSYPTGKILQPLWVMLCMLLHRHLVEPRLFHPLATIKR